MQEQKLVPDVWSVIFSHLEPCFLFDVVRVSQLFNRTASSDTVFFKKLQQYFPNEWQALPVPAGVTQKAKFIFKKLYARQFATLKSSASRRLLSYIIEGDIEQIRKFPVDGDKLYEMLTEKDAYGKDMLFYVNRSSHPAMNTEIMKLYVRAFYGRLHSWNPLTICNNWIDKLSRTVLGMPTLNDECRHIYDMAAALNLDVLKSIKNESRYVCDKAMVHAIRYGHLASVEILLEIYAQSDPPYRRFGILDDDHHPLVVAAKYDQLAIARRLLELGIIAAGQYKIERGMHIAVSCHSLQVFDLLLTTYYNFPEMTKKKVHDFVYYALLDKILAVGHVDILEMILKRMVDHHTGKNKDKSGTLWQIHGWQLKHILHDVTRIGNLGMVDAVLNIMLRADKPVRNRMILRDTMSVALQYGSINIIKAVLDRGYVPHKEFIKNALNEGQFELYNLLNDVRMQHRPQVITRKMM